MARKDAIYLDSWLTVKPYKKSVKTDGYYLRLCNEVKRILETTGQIFLRNLVDSGELKSLTCILVSYFEDVISESGVWEAFVSVHERKYGKPLPFYPCEDYAEQEINEEDVAFLIWNVVTTLDPGVFLNPYDVEIGKIAAAVMEVFEREYETAPENEDLFQWFHPEILPDDYYGARHFMGVILFGSYLFHLDTEVKFLAQQQAIMNGEDENLEFMLSESHDEYLHKTPTRLMAMTADEWAVEILGKDHPAAEAFEHKSARLSGFFMARGAREEAVVFEHIASGEIIEVIRESLSDMRTLPREGTICFLGVVEWNSKWWFSGNLFSIPYDGALIDQEKQSVDSLKAVDFLMDPKVWADNMKRMSQAFRDYTDGKLLLFLPAEEIIPYMKTYFLHLEEKAEKEEGFPRWRTVPEDFPPVPIGIENGLIFHNPLRGPETLLGANPAFAAEDNPEFEPDEAPAHILDMLVSDECSIELFEMCIHLGEGNIPFLDKGIGRILVSDLDFILRYWKTDLFGNRPGNSLFL